MARFFVTPDKVADGVIKIDTADVAHIKKVLRLGAGDEIEVCDSRGTDYTARIENVGDGLIECRVLSQTATQTEPGLFVTLYQGIPKGTKMDYIIQKTTELGISRIVPVIMERCVVKLENEKAEQKKQERWARIAGEAAKQSGRGIIPEVEMPMRFEAALGEMKTAELAFIPYECERVTKPKQLFCENAKAANVSFMIGPEGGFDPKEIGTVTEAGIPTITLGKRILRTETAGEAVLSMLMYEIGDINK